MRSYDDMDWCNGRNSSVGSTPLVTRGGGYDYVALIRKDWKLVICQRAVGSTGAWTKVVLSDLGFTQIGNVEATDSHNCIALCVDGLGYLHITGNTHDAVFPTNRFNYLRSQNPHDISSWDNILKDDIVGWTENSTDIYSCSTYSHFRTFSDGGVLWFMSMSEDGGSIGRDIGVWYCAPDSNEFLPAQGGTTTDLMACTSNAVDGADRCYMMAIGIDDNDVVHFVGTYRDVEANSVASHLHSIYLRSDDRGATWEDFDGGSVTTPVRRNAMGTTEILIDGTDGATFRTSSHSMAFDSEDRPVFGLSDGSHVVIHHDGTEWRRWVHPNAPGFQNNAEPVVVDVGDGMWIFGYDASLALGEPYGAQMGYWMGRPWTPDVDSNDDWFVNFGVMIGGTHSPNDTDQFQNGKVFYPVAKVHGGTSNGKSAAKFFFPDDDEPTFRCVGVHPQLAS